MPRSGYILREMAFQRTGHSRGTGQQFGGQNVQARLKNHRRGALPELLSVFDFALDDAAIAEIEAADFVRSLLDVGEIERAPGSVMMRAIRGQLD